VLRKTHLDLFSGIGGFAIAAQNCGYTTIGFCEKEPYAQQILKERFGAVLAAAESEREHGEHGDTGGAGSSRHKSKSQPASRVPRIHPDIFGLNGSDYAGVDLLTGGFPCQPFSVAGKRRGAEDDRALWPQMLRVIDGAKPAWLIGENVAGIVSMELDNILSDLEGIGYAAWPLVIPACAVDARHRRDRVWIVAHAEGGQDHGRNGGSVDEATRRGECLNAAVIISGEDVAYAHSGRGEQRDKNERSLSKPDSECAGIGEDVAHADGPSPQGNQRTERGTSKRTNPGEHCQWRDEGEWFAESGMGRVAHGIPNRAHRLRGLGNAIVPQVAEEIIRNLQY